MNTDELLAELAQARHEYAAAMAQVAVARQDRIADGDHERREIRIARVLAMEIQGHELHIANRIAAITALSSSSMTWSLIGKEQRMDLVDELLVLADFARAEAGGRDE